MSRLLLVTILCTFTLVLALPSDGHAQRRGGVGGALGGAIRNAAGVPELSRTPLLPSGVHAGYSALDAENPLGDDYEYLVTGIAHYDHFFQSVARVRGSVALANTVLARVDAVTESGVIDTVMSGAVFTDAAGTVIDVPMSERRRVFMLAISGNISGAQSAAGGVADGQIETLRATILAEHADIVALSELLPVAAESLTALPHEVTALATMAPTLATEAPSAFAGPQAVNAPRVGEEIGRASASLGSLPDEIAEAARGIAALTTVE